MLAKQMDYTMVRSPQWECERLSETWGEKNKTVCLIINTLWSFGLRTKHVNRKSAPSLCALAFCSFLLSVNTKCFSSSQKVIFLFLICFQTRAIWAGNKQVFNGQKLPAFSFWIFWFRYLLMFLWIWAFLIFFCLYCNVEKIVSPFIHIWLGGFV